MSNAVNIMAILAIKIDQTAFSEHARTQYSLWVSMEWDQELQSSFWSHRRDNQAILNISTSKEPNIMHLIWCLFIPSDEVFILYDNIWHWQECQ